MKKILLGILAFAAVACNNDVVVNEQTASEITFGDSFVEVKTRGAADPSTTTDGANGTNAINAFDVWGFMDKTSGTVFNQERVTRDENGWSYLNTQWWYPSKEYYFYAVSPVNDSNIVVNTDAMNTDGLGNIAFTNEKGITDLLYASKHVVTDDTDPYFEDSNTGDKVSLQFMHLLSKIKFTFTNGFPNDNTTLKVTNIKIVDAPAKGNVDVNIESRLDYAWNIVQGETTTLEFGNVNGGQPLASAESQECDFERLTIPADASRTYTIEFDLEIFTGTESGLTSHKVVPLETQAFASGKNYNIVAVINDENFAEEALRPIEFDVITVEDWVENNFDGNLDWDDEQGSNPDQGEPEPEPFTPVASEWGVVGDLNGWGNDTVMYTTETENLFVAQNVEIASGSFKIRANKQWDNTKNYGLEVAGKISVDKYYTVWSDGGSSNITPMAYGTYDVYFDLTNKRVALMTPGKAYAEAEDGGKPVVVVEGLKDHEWGVVG